MLGGEQCLILLEENEMSRGSSGSVGTRLQAGRPGLDSRQGQL
jgi:hypothetical protein